MMAAATPAKELATAAAMETTPEVANESAPAMDSVGSAMEATAAGGKNSDASTMESSAAQEAHCRPDPLMA
jgi:hypothetical protein